MKKRGWLKAGIYISFVAAFAALSLTSCGGKKEDGAARREAYTNALDDSIAAVTAEIDSCTNGVKEMHDQAGKWLLDFTTVENPREVGSYIIYTPFRNRYPLTATGLVARVIDTGEFQLVAALSKGTFDRIEVSCGDITLSSETVPHDQALNYRTAGLNTVTFSGEKADSIGRFICDNELENIRVSYCGNGVAGSWTMPEDYKKMVMATWMFYNSSRSAKHLEQREAKLHEKLNLLRAHRDRLK